MSSPALVDVQNLVKTYGPLRALDGLSFQVRPGEIVALLGANGAGKSTLMKVLTGYLVADAGSATVAGVSLDRDPVEVRRHIGYLPENAPLYSEMRVKDFLFFVARLRGLPRVRAQGKIEWAVQACGLEPKYMADIGTLSRGYRQRVGIAQAILHDPDLLILDEPTSGLDPIQIIEIRRLIMEIGKSKTVFFSTHIMQEVEAVCNRALILAKGRLAADGSPAELKLRDARRGCIVARLRGAQAAAVTQALRAVEGVRRVEVFELRDAGFLECRLEVSEPEAAPDPQDVNRAAERFFALAREAGWVVVELRSEGLSLEDVFLRVWERGQKPAPAAPAAPSAPAQPAGAGVQP